MTTTTPNTATPMTDVTARLNNLKAQIETGKAQKAKAEANLETYTKQLDDVKAEIQGLGVEPTVDALDAEITKLDAEIVAGLSKAEGLLKGDAGQ